MSSSLAANMRHYIGSLTFTAVCLALAAWYGWSNTSSLVTTFNILWIVIVLSVLEVSLSFDNAVVNASVLMDSTLDGPANLLVMPGLDAAKIGASLLSAATDAMPLGPIIIGFSRPLHILSPNVTTRGIVNMAAICATQASSDRSAQCSERW